jgi:hypothetical protein
MVSSSSAPVGARGIYLLICLAISTLYAQYIVISVGLTLDSGGIGGPLGVAAAMSKMERDARAEIDRYIPNAVNTANQDRQLLCAVFSNATLDRAPILHMLEENMKILGSYCDFALVSFKCHPGATRHLNAMAQRTNSTLALYRCTNNSHIRNRFLQKTVLFNRLLDVIRLYRWVWILDEDLSFDSFSPKWFFRNAFCSFYQQPLPMIITPTVFNSVYRDSYQYFGHWKGTGAIAAGVNYVSMRMPLMNSLFFEWFLTHIINPFVALPHTVYHDDPFSHLLCSSAWLFAKEYYGSEFDASKYRPCVITTTDNTSVYHFETDVLWNRPLNEKTMRSKELLADSFPTLFSAEKETVDAVYNSSAACIPDITRTERRAIDMNHVNVGNDDDKGLTARMQKIRLLVSDWLVYIENGNAAGKGSWNNDTTKAYAFYFPQFHKDKLNDRLWGEGFSDWDSLVAAAGVNKHHDSLARPTTFGYYDLMDKNIRRKQGELARKYGLDGFIYHHYFFYEPGLGPTLAGPLEAMLQDNEPNIRFAFHWANTDWTATWQGVSISNYSVGHTLQRQHCPNASDPLVHEHYQYLRRFFHHPNYIRVNGAPLFLVYKAESKSCRAIITELRRMAINDGFPSPGLHVPQPRPNIGHEVSHHWTLHEQARMEDPASLEVLNNDSVPTSVSNEGALPEFDADIYYPSHHSLRANVLPQHCYGGIFGNETRPAYLSVITSFDNTPRRGYSGSTVWDRHWEAAVAAPLSFEKDVIQTIFYESCCQKPSARASGGKFVAINAWNEWGEGMILEPSQKYGISFLEALFQAKRVAQAIKCDPELLATYLGML